MIKPIESLNATTESDEKKLIEEAWSRRYEAQSRLIRIESMLKNRIGISSLSENVKKEEKSLKMSELLVEAHKEFNALKKDWTNLVLEEDVAIVVDELQHEVEIKRGWKSGAELNKQLSDLESRLQEIYSEHGERVEHTTEQRQEEIKLIKESFKAGVMIGLDVKKISESEESNLAREKMRQYKSALLKKTSQEELASLKKEAWEANEKAINELIAKGDELRTELIRAIKSSAEAEKELLYHELDSWALLEEDKERIKDKAVAELLREFNISE